MRTSNRWLFFGALVSFLAVGLAGLLFWAPWRPRPPVATARQEAIRFRSGDNELVGVLVLPSGPGPHPAVVFVNGSGPTDRAAGGLCPPLWEHFAQHGFASLSWDKPGVGQSTGDFESQTFDDRAREALAAVRFLRGRSDIRAEQVGLWGFSQGATVVPLAASLSSDVAFVISVSGSQVLAWEQDIYRVGAELRADGFAEADVAEAVAFARRRMALIRGAGPFEALEESQTVVEHRSWFPYAHRCDRARFRSGGLMVEHDPGPSWERARCPVLAIFGQNDRSCPVERSVAVVRQRLARGGNRDVTIKVFPRADHRIAVSDTGGRKEASERARQRPSGAGPDFAPGYLNTMSDWLTERFGTGGSPPS
jgi:dienelactone hydrolase